MPETRLPGPVFISHSSEDKDFVRRLDSDLEAHRFETWLDEKSMVVGDSLPAKISSGLEDAAAVVVVISPASENSDWLHYELQLATERMVKGLRVIPALLQDATIPPEIRSLLYADFRDDYDAGLDAIIRSLEQLAETLADDAGPPPFYKHVEARLKAVFDGVGYMSLMGEYKSRDYSVCHIDVDGGDDIEIVYDEASDYLEKQEAIRDGFWREFLDENEESLSEFLLLVSERPLEISTPLLDPGEPRVRVQYVEASAPMKLMRSRKYESVAFAADFSGELPDAEQERLLRLIREKITEIHTQESGT